MQSGTLRSKLRKRLSIWVACGLALPLTLHAQTAELPARWMDWHVQAIDSKCAGDKELAAQTVVQLKRVVWAFLKANPGYPSKGYADARLVPIREMPPLFKGGCDSNPLRGNADISVLREDQVVFATGGKGRATGRKYGSEGGLGGFSIVANQIPNFGFVDALSSIRDTNNPYWVLTQARTTSTFQGYPVLNHTHIVITPPGYPPLYIPVPIEQALGLALPGAEQAVAAEVTFSKEETERMAEDGEFMKGMKAAGATKKQLQDLKSESAKVTAQRLQLARATLDLLKGRLAKLTSANKGAPAYWKNELPQAEADDGAEPLVTINPAYFDKRLARSVPQLLVISGFDDTQLDRPEPVGDWQAVQKVDWKALAKELLH